MAGKSTLLVAVLAGVLLSGSAGAVDAEVGISYTDTDGDTFLSDATTTVLDAKYYFDRVSTSRSPHDLQPFLQQVSFAQVRYRTADADWWDANRLDVNAEFYMAPPLHRLSFRPHISHNGIYPLIGPDRTFFTWTLDIGCYVTDELKVTLPGAVVGYLDEDEGEVVDGNLSTKRLLIEYVARTGRENIYMAVGGTLDVDNNLVFLSVGGTYYPNRELGLGLTLGNNENGVDNIALGFTYWPNPTVRLGLTYTMHTDDAIITDIFEGTTALGEATTVGFSVIARF